MTMQVKGLKQNLAHIKYPQNSFFLISNFATESGKTDSNKLLAHEKM